MSEERCPHCGQTVPELVEPGPGIGKMRADPLDTERSAAEGQLNKTDKGGPELYLFIEAWPEGLTDDELEEKLDKVHDPRRLELEELGWVYRTKDRRRTRSGAFAGVYKLTTVGARKKGLLPPRKTKKRKKRKKDR